MQQIIHGINESLRQRIVIQHLDFTQSAWNRLQASRVAKYVHAGI